MWSPQRWHTECSVDDSKLLQVFGNLHHRQRSILWHLNCFMKIEKDTRHQTWRIPNFAQDMNVTFLEEKKKKSHHLLSLIKCKYTVAKAFIDFLLLSDICWCLSGLRMYEIWSTVEPWKPALVACSSRMQYRCPSPGVCCCATGDTRIDDCLSGDNNLGMQSVGKHLKCERVNPQVITGQTI